MKSYDAFDVTLLPGNSQIVVLDSVYQKLEFTYICAPGQHYDGSACVACPTDTYSAYIDDEQCSELCPSSTKSLKHAYCHFTCASAEQFGQQCETCAAYRARFHSALNSVDGLNSATCKVEETACSAGSLFASIYSLCIADVKDYLSLQSSSGYDACLTENSCESCNTLSSRCSYYPTNTLCSSTIANTGITETPAVCNPYVCPSLTQPADTNATSTLLILEAGQSCEWKLTVAEFEYTLNLTRAADGNDALQFTAVDSNSTLVTAYTAPLNFTIDNWFKIVYSRSADHANRTEGLLVNYTNIVDPYYVPPPPVVIVEPEPEPEPPEPQPVVQSEGVSLMLVLIIVVPGLLLVLTIVVSVVLVRRCRRRRRARTKMEDLKKGTVGVEDCSGGSQTLFNNSFTNIRSFSITKGGPDESYELSPQRSSVDLNCEPIQEEEEHSDGVSFTLGNKRRSVELPETVEEGIGGEPVMVKVIEKRVVQEEGEQVFFGTEPEKIKRAKKYFEHLTQ